MGEQFDKAVSMKELCEAIRQCKRGVSHKDGPTDWYNHAYTKAKSLKDEIERGRYKLRPGSIVKIYRPKYREASRPGSRTGYGSGPCATTACITI